MTAGRFLRERLIFKLLQDIREAAEPIPLELLNAPLVGEGGKLGRQGHPSQKLQPVGIGGGLGLPRAEEGDLPAAVGAEEVAHVLHHAHNGGPYSTASVMGLRKAANTR